VLNEGRVILHEAYYADCFIENNEIKKFEDTGYYQKGVIDSQNQNLKFYYDTMKEFCGDRLKVVCLKDTEVFIADSEHRWGKEAFHYTKSYYTEFLKKIDEITESKK
jgi:hypothetical protein